LGDPAVDHLLVLAQLLSHVDHELGRLALGDGGTPGPPPEEDAAVPVVVNQLEELDDLSFGLLLPFQCVQLLHVLTRVHNKLLFFAVLTYFIEGNETLRLGLVLLDVLNVDVGLPLLLLEVLFFHFPFLLEFKLTLENHVL